MRRIRYKVACSLDGYIAGPQDEFDWIIGDPDIDFEAIWNEFDTLLMGRRTYEVMAGEGGGTRGKEVVVFSRTLRQEDHPEVPIVSDDATQVLDELRARPGKDIWLFGGGELFRSLLEIGQVDTVELAFIPVLLGDGLQLLASPAIRRTLSLTERRVYANSGIVSLEYAVDPID